MIEIYRVENSDGIGVFRSFSSYRKNLPYELWSAFDECYDVASRKHHPIGSIILDMYESEFCAFRYPHSLLDVFNKRFLELKLMAGFTIKEMMIEPSKVRFANDSNNQCLFRKEDIIESKILTIDELFSLADVSEGICFS